MKRLIIILLLIVIIAAFGFVLIKSQAIGSENNYFNKNWRSKVAQSTMLRNIFGLHIDGDGKADYLGTKYSKIKIEIDSMQGVNVPYDEINKLADQIETVTKKSTTTVYSDDTIPYKDVLSEQEVNEIAIKYRNYKNTSDTASLYVLIASKDQDELLGATIFEYGLVIYEDTVKYLTTINPELFGAYMDSTLLHEFGHQLGLDHNSEPNCLMNAEVERRSLVFQNPDEVVTNFCEFELNQIDQNRGN